MFEIKGLEKRTETLHPIENVYAFTAIIDGTMPTVFIVGDHRELVRFDADNGVPRIYLPVSDTIEEWVENTSKNWKKKITISQIFCDPNDFKMTFEIL